MATSESTRNQLQRTKSNQNAWSDKYVIFTYTLFE